MDLRNWMGASVTALALALMLTACGDDDGMRSDAGPVDATTDASDAETDVDADIALDAAIEVDADIDVDAADEIDASFQVDAAVEVDADTCTPIATSDSTCDGVDDDCDGSEDEDYAPAATTCGMGACRDTGMTSCTDGEVVDSCAPGKPAASDATCDGVDDDCSGAADEEFSETSSSCGVGACRSAGTVSCVGGTPVDSCVPRTPAASDLACDGVDEDCDSSIDEDCVLTVDFCRLQLPLSTSLTAGESTTVYGRVYVAGLTDRSSGNDTHPRLLAQVGYGAVDTTPSDAWMWIGATPNVAWTGAEQNNDEYEAALTAPAGSYDYAYRFSGDGGATWLYCDGQSAGSNDGYQVENAGALTVMAPPPSITALDHAALAHGARIVITGTNLADVTEVSIDGVMQPIDSASDAQIAFFVDDATPIGVGRSLALSSPAGSDSESVTVIHLVVNELDADTPGTDALEFVEITTGVAAMVDLSGYQLVLINGGSTDATYASVLLGGTDAAGYFLVGNTAAGVDAVLAGNTVQQGEDAAALVQSGVLVPPDTALAALPRVLDALVYDTNDADDPQLLARLLGPGAAAVQINEALFGTADTDSIQRCAPARRDGRVFSSVNVPTPRAANTCGFTEAEVQARLSTQCSTCHGASAGFAVGASFVASTVGVPSTQVPSMPRITAGNHALSYLWHKLNNTHATTAVGGIGSRMPAGGRPPWTAQELRRLAAYINSL